MVADSNTAIDAVADAAKAQANTAAETTKAVAKAGEERAKTASDAGKRVAKAATKARRSSIRKARNSAKAATRKTTARKTNTRKTTAARAKAQPARNERNDQMKFDPSNVFAGFGAFPGAPAFEKLFAQAAERGEDAAKRSRKAAEQLADLYRGNIDAFVEAGRIAATGAQSIGQDIAAKSRDGIEQAANGVRALTEAKSPTELLQLQSEYARTAFDRFVEDSSALTEKFVKLAGEAFQPISNRASSNVEKLNDIAA